MKKITLLALLLTFSIGNAQTIEGTWKMTPAAAALGVGPNLGDISWWSNSAGDVTTRGCYFDDEFMFNADGSFSNIHGTQTWLEGWQGFADGCGTPVAPHNSSNAASWVYNSGANTLTLTGIGAYLGLSKVYNGGELSNPANAPESITYTVTALTASSMVLDISIGGGWWRFNLTKQGVAPSCSDGIQNGDETGVDCGGSCPNVCLAQINLPVTFEGTITNYAVTDFGGTSSSLVADPENASNMVMKVIKTVGAAGWAGTTMSTDSGFSSPVPFTSTNKKMYVKVWAANAGIPVRLKVEDHANVNHYVEKDALTTASGWQTLEFDFATPATAAFDPSFIYDKASIFFNFVPDVTNATELTFYFDDVSYGSSLANSSFNLASSLKVYPNPANNVITVDSFKTIESITIVNLLGQEVISKNTNSDSVTLDISSLQNGIYILKTTVGGSTATSRIIKE